MPTRKTADAIKVLVVDDSAVVRQVASAVLSKAADIEVIGAVADPLFAIERMRRKWPDVILLDVEMPRMDGITFLRKLMSERPTAVVICSSLTEANAQTTIEALEAGAVRIVCKPKIGAREFLEDASDDLVDAVREAAGANLRRLCASQRLVAQPSSSVPPKLTTDAVLRNETGAKAMSRTTDAVIAIGTSTGGTQALELLLQEMPKDCPGLVIVQHMPEKFTASFAKRLDGLCGIEVREARSSDRVLPGLALIAPGGKHMVLCRNGAQYHVDVIDGPPVNRHRPSVDVLFRSVAQRAGRNAVGVIMTGMGDDGANGLLEMRQAGAHTLAQDEESCVVFGMPKEAIQRGAAEQVVSLQELSQRIVQLYQRR
jgi:two-component system chemotaxis response regulator CheB